MAGTPRRGGSRGHAGPFGGAQDQSGDLVRCLPGRSLESVRVDAESGRHRGVIEPGVDSGLEHGRRIAVPHQLQESP